MDDKSTTVNDLKVLLARFVKARAWEKFHTPENTAIAVMTEAAELVENFLWREKETIPALLENPEFRRRVEDEMADVLAFLLALANVANVDLAASFEGKMKRNEKRFPVSEYYGRYEHLP